MSKEEVKSKADNLPASTVLLYLFLMPLAFTASLHYLDSKHSTLELKRSDNPIGDMSRFKYLMADIEEIRKTLLFYSPDNQYIPISKTNHAFNYSLPVLGQREMKVIKGKEENLFRSANEQEYIVVSH